MAQVAPAPDIEYTSALLTRILSHRVSMLTTTSGVPDEPVENCRCTWPSPSPSPL